MCRICVAWYPVYRIPDAPLTAKFLTYHSLTPVACSATHYGAVCLAPTRKAPAAQPGSQVCLPTIGLKCCSLGDGSWLDDLPGVTGELPTNCRVLYASLVKLTASLTHTVCAAPILLLLYCTQLYPGGACLRGAFA